MSGLNARQIAMIAEAAFRRGYQQGYQDGLALIRTVDLHDWRYNEPLDMAIAPQIEASGRYRTTSLSRLWIENGHSFELIRLPDADP